MKQNIFRACGLFFLAFLCTSQTAVAGMLAKPDLDKLFGEQFLVGDIQPGMPLWPLFAKNPPAADASSDPPASAGPATQAVASTQATQAATTPVTTETATTDNALSYKSTRQQTKKPRNRSIEQQIDQPTNQPTHQPNNQPTKQPTNLPINKHQFANQQGSQSIKQLRNEKTN